MKSKIFSVLDTIPSSIIKNSPLRSPPNKAIFCSGGVFFSQEHNKIESSSLNDARAYNVENGGGYAILDDNPSIAIPLAFFRKLYGNRIIPPEIRVQSIRKMGVLPSVIFAAATKGERFNVVLHHPHPASVFRMVELPILMSRCDHLERVTDITKTPEGNFFEDVHDKLRWYEKSCESWFQESMQYFRKAQEGYESGKIPKELYISAAKRLLAEIEGSAIFLHLNRNLHTTRLKEQRYIDMAFEAIKDIPEIRAELHIVRQK